MCSVDGICEMVVDRKATHITGDKAGENWKPFNLDIRPSHRPCLLWTMILLATHGDPYPEEILLPELQHVWE